MSHPPLPLQKEEGVSKICTKLALAPLSLWGPLDHVTPMYAPQQMTTPLPFDFCFSSPWCEPCQWGLHLSDFALLSSPSSPPQMALFPVPPEQPASLQVPGGLTSMRCSSAFPGQCGYPCFPAQPKQRSELTSSKEQQRFVPPPAPAHTPWLIPLTSSALTRLFLPSPRRTEFDVYRLPTTFSHPLGQAKKGVFPTYPPSPSWDH